MRQFLLSLFVLGVIAACNEDTDRAFIKPDKIVNPNGDSDLSIAMRNMHYEAYEVRQKLNDEYKPDLNALIEVSRKINTAEATDPSVRDSTFNALAANLLSTIPKIQGANRYVEFHNMVNACLDCHNRTCPGPRMKIRKLLDFD